MGGRVVGIWSINHIDHFDHARWRQAGPGRLGWRAGKAMQGKTGHESLQARTPPTQAGSSAGHTGHGTVRYTHHGGDGSTHTLAVNQAARKRTGGRPFDS
jgi:hypothetical protein